MSREGIIGSLFPRGITLTSLVYSQPQVSVYQGMYKGIEAAVKVLHTAPGQDPMALEEESQALMNMQHQAILKVFDFCWLPEGTYTYLVIVTEWCSKDLWKDIENRRVNKYPFEEKHLWIITYQLVEAFAHMQSLGYAHQDIKPENIFLFLDGSIRVGDLGSTGYISSDFCERRVVGTPIYMSPALRGAIASSRRTAFHNAFKSDVYSLGLTLLTMATLQKPVTFICGDVDEAERVIGSVPYSSGFKALLSNMLCEDEQQRGDFRQLKEWLGLKQAHQLEVSGDRDIGKADTPQPSPRESPDSYPVVEMTESRDGEDSCRTISVQLPTEIIRREQPEYASESHRTEHIQLADRRRLQASYLREERKTRPDFSQPPDIVEEEICLSHGDQQEKSVTDWGNELSMKISDYSDVIPEKHVHSENMRLHKSYQSCKKEKSKDTTRSRGRKEPSRFFECDRTEPPIPTDQAYSANHSLAPGDPYEPQSQRYNPNTSRAEEVPEPLDSVKCASCLAEGRFAQQFPQECSHGTYLYCTKHWADQGLQLGCPEHCFAQEKTEPRKKSCCSVSAIAGRCKWLLCCWCKLC